MIKTFLYVLDKQTETPLFFNKKAVLLPGVMIEYKKYISKGERKMKKKFKQLLCVMLAVMLCMSAAAPVMAANRNQAIAIAKYKSYLKKNKGRYSMVDIDRNGIPELVLHNTTKRRNELFTYSPKLKRTVCLKCQYWYKNQAMPKYSVSKHTVVFPTSDTGGHRYYAYRVSGTKAKLVLRTEYINGRFARLGPKYRKAYKVNGKKVSRAVYSSKLAAVSRGGRYPSKVSK